MKLEFKYILMSKMPSEKRFSPSYSFTYRPEEVLQENQEMWPKWEFKVVLNKNYYKYNKQESLNF